MRRTIRAALFCFALFLMLSVSAHAAMPLSSVPATIDPAARHLIFFHNYYVETKGPDGDCKYFDILKSFADKGFTVISEIRPKDISVIEYGKKAAVEVRKLLDAGVPPQNIAVAGHSKGGVIVLQVASIVARPQVNYVVMAGCGIKGLEKGYPDFAGMKGNFLSIYASSDKVAGSCSGEFAKAKEGFSGKEIILESPAGHQLFFKPADLWLEPVTEWLNNKR